jgi:hypothetical protein
MDSGTDHDSTCDQPYRHQPARRVVLGIGIGLYLLSVGGTRGRPRRADSVRSPPGFRPRTL